MTGVLRARLTDGLGRPRIRSNEGHVRVMFLGPLGINSGLGVRVARLVNQILMAINQRDRSYSRFVQDDKRREWYLAGVGDNRNRTLAGTGELSYIERDWPSRWGGNLSAHRPRSGKDRVNRRNALFLDWNW